MDVSISVVHGLIGVHELSAAPTCVSFGLINLECHGCRDSTTLQMHGHMSCINYAVGGSREAEHAEADGRAAPQERGHLL